MNEPKPLASLNGDLLARKGAARPAMRSQMLIPPPIEETDSLDPEDLGRDDLGEAEKHRHANIFSLAPSPAKPQIRSGYSVASQPKANSRHAANGMSSDMATKPKVLVQQEEITAKFNHRAADPANHKVPVIAKANGTPSKPAKKPAKTARPKTDAHRAAFTLRLDDDRHLRLRLACAIRNNSAQQIVTEALDRLLDNMPDLESLAAQVKRQ